jgi:hypothetical protein
LEVFVSYNFHEKVTISEKVTMYYSNLQRKLLKLSPKF